MELYLLILLIITKEVNMVTKHIKNYEEIEFFLFEIWLDTTNYIIHD